MGELFDAGDLCDGIVQVGERSIPVSRMTLAATSSFFRAAFAGGMREADTATVALDPTLDADSVHALLRYAHAPGVSCQVDPEALLGAIDQLGFLELLPKIGSVLAASLDKVNCLQRMALADRHGAALDMVLKRGVEVLSEHATELCASPTFAALSQDLLSAILSHEDTVADEAALFNGVLQWRAADASRHGAPFDALLEQLRLPSLGLDYLIRHVMHAEEIMASARARQLVQDAVAYLTIPAQRAALTSPRMKPRVKAESVICSKNELKLVQSWLPDSCKLSALVFRASRDGWAKADFNRMCNGVQKFVVVVRSESDHVFGGYSDVAYTPSDGAWKTSDEAFLFAIRVADASCTQPTKLPLIGIHDEAVFMHGSPLVAFGAGHDLCIGPEANTRKSSYSFLGCSYSWEGAAAQGTRTISTLFTGERYCLLTEIEVFRVE